MGGDGLDIVRSLGIGPVDCHPCENVSRIAMNNQHGTCAPHLVQYSPDGVVGFDDDHDGDGSLIRFRALQVRLHRVLSRAR
jgi:hypothetical protein